MSCPGLSAEDYRLYALGLCEPAEADQIRAHLARGCPLCAAEMRHSEAEWHEFAVMEAELHPARPRPHLRRRVLEGVLGTAAPAPFQVRWWWPAFSAAAVLIVVASGVGWYAGSRSVPPREVTVRTPAPAPPSDELAQLRRRLEAAQQALAARARPLEPARPPAGTSGLEQALADARRAASEAQQALGGQLSRASALEAELQNQRSLLATATRERLEALDRGRALTEARSAADERDRQIRALTARVQQLERENVEFRNVIDRQRREVEQHVQLAGLLNSPSLRMVRLESTGKGAAALGYAFMEGTRVHFYASRLPDLPAGRTYQLWLIRGRAPAVVSAGVFQAGSGQRGSVNFTDARMLSNVTALAVTDEPAGGSPLPTGHKFLIGAVRPG